MMTLETTASNTQKIGSINALRFLAAMFVLFYHFCFVFYYAKTTQVDIPVLRELFKYGYLGVELFFIISGFVISLSAEGRNAYSFLKSRLGRLYPVFWASAVVTGVFLVFGGSIINQPLSLSKFLANLTMVPQIIPGSYTLLDPSYWTLAVEIKFYFIIFLLLIFKQFKRIELFSILASIFITLGIFFTDIPIIWTSYFIAGILFYKVYKEGLTPWRIFGLCNTLFISIYFALARIPSHNLNFKGTEFNPTTITLYILSFFVMFLLISLNKIKIANNRYINILGVLTYPLYLLHQQVARILFTYGNIKEIPLYISFTVTIILLFVISYIIHRLFERHGRVFIDHKIDRVTPNFIKNL
jgi:peptidoglycan/LPS O-acetylase OafA/YrhL